jgi:hypothetical protein
MRNWSTGEDCYTTGEEVGPRLFGGDEQGYGYRGLALDVIASYLHAPSTNSRFLSYTLPRIASLKVF